MLGFLDHEQCAWPELQMMNCLLKVTLDCLFLPEKLPPVAAKFSVRVESWPLFFFHHSWQWRHQLHVLENCLRTGRCDVSVPRHPREVCFTPSSLRVTLGKESFPTFALCGPHWRLKDIWEKQCGSWPRASEMVSGCPRADIHSFIRNWVNIYLVQPMCQSL